MDWVWDWLASLVNPCSLHLPAGYLGKSLSEPQFVHQ